MSSQIVKTEGRSSVAAAGIWQSSTQPSGPIKDDDGVLDLFGVFRVLSRQRRWIYGSAALILALAGAVCLVMTPRYTAMAQIELLKQEQGGLSVGVQEGQTQSGAAHAEDALSFSLSLQTAVSVLESDALALRVIKELHLEDTDEFTHKPLLPFLQTDKAKQAFARSVDESSVKRTAILKTWSKRLNVRAVAGTRIIEVSYSHRDPEMAARIVNQLLSDYVDYRYEVRYAALQLSTSWVTGKLAQAKSQAEEAARRLADASQPAGMYGVSDSGHNIVVQRLEQLDTAAAEAHANRTSKEAIYRLAQNGDPELLTGLVGGAQSGNGEATSVSLLVSLRQQEADLSAQYAEGAAKYGADNPKFAQLRNKLQSARNEVKSETDRIAGRAHQEYLAALSAETEANLALDQQKLIAADMQRKMVNYGIAKNESDSAQALYQKLLDSAQTTPILAGIRSTDINIVNAALPPGKPSSPIIPLYLAAGAFGGILFGVAGAFIRDSLDTSLRYPEDIEQITQLPVLGVIPRARMSGQGKKKAFGKAKSRTGALNRLLSDNESPAVPSLSSSQSQVMESFRSVRSSILLSHPDNPRRVFVMTSAQPGEGKSFSCLHLSAALAQNGGSVLLVDGDLRRATLSRNLNMAFRIGLSTLIAGSSDAASYREIAAVPGLTFVPAGASPPNPAELVGSRRMAQLIAEWRDRYDFVVIDCPPVLPVTDAVVLSQLVDGVLIVTRFAVSKQRAISRAVRTLLSARAECFGVVVNDMDTKSDEYGCYGKYYGSKADEDTIEGEPEVMAASGQEKQ